MTWTRPFYLNYDDRKWDKVFSIGIKNLIILLDKHKHKYSYPKIKLFIWKNKIDTHHN